jgi:hypothetical protein
MAELLATVQAFAVPTPGSRPRLARSVELLELSGVPGRGVAASVRRLAPSPLTGPGELAADATDELLRRTMAALCTVPGAPVQSVLATGMARYGNGSGPPWRRVRVAARVETVGGPVIVGSGNGVPAAGSFPDRLGPSGPPAGWTGRPIVLTPPVAAIVASAARLALTSRSMRERYPHLVGRRILPALSIVDGPAMHDENGYDDAGRPASRHPMVAEGVLRPVPFDPQLGVIEGRAFWNHDRQAAGAAPMACLSLSGPQGEPTADALEVRWCVEGLQRYHADGVLRLRCLAHPTGDTVSWFGCELRGRPLNLLRAAAGMTGLRLNVFSDDEVTTGSLVLPNAEVLRERYATQFTTG